MGIFEYRGKLKSFDIYAAAMAAIEATEKEFVLENQRQLYNDGQDKEGKNLKPYANPIYAVLKDTNPNKPRGAGFQKQSSTMTPNLFDTGDFFNGMYLFLNGGTVDVDSTDEKTGELIQKYGDNIFGLNFKHLETYRQEFLYAAFIKEFYKHMAK